MLINKPMSLFLDTHFQTSIKVKELMDPVQTTQEILDVDTSMCENYDEPGVNTARLSKISMNMPSN